MKYMFISLLILPLLFAMAASSASAENAPKAPMWSPFEITLTARGTYANPYTDVDVFADFSGPNGQSIRRPAFWDGGGVWRVRFAPPTPKGRWTWRSVCSNTSDTGLHDQRGALVSAPSRASDPLRRKGLLRMSPGHRSVVHADGSPMLLAGDTAWSLPWRATLQTAAVYAEDRRKKGFNCVLLMSVQPDRKASGPRERNVAGGFDVGFEDLPEGRLNHLNPSYFQYVDRLMAILLDHGLVPVYQPVFQGYGWKGMDTLGGSADPAEYARYCRYLVARYGASPAIWLVGADSDGLAPCIAAGGEEIRRWDAYHQPIGLHYNPWRETIHLNRSHQAADWLDFQWCQTGHDGRDVNLVSAMADNLPTKAAADGEPTYEGIGNPAKAAGWWQGDRAWSNLTWGGTMGVFYGAAALWQWKITPDEAGWPAWAVDGHSWRSALDLPGSTYVGYVAKALQGYDTTDMTRRPELAAGAMCAAKPGVFYCVYLPEGGDVTLSGLTHSLPLTWFNPKTGKRLASERTAGAEYRTSAPDRRPWVLLAGDRKSSR